MGSNEDLRYQVPRSNERNKERAGEKHCTWVIEFLHFKQVA